MSSPRNTSRYVYPWLCAQLLPHALCKEQLHGATRLSGSLLSPVGTKDRAGGQSAGSGITVVLTARDENRGAEAVDKL
jgi:hypothetical protein